MKYIQLKDVLTQNGYKVKDLWDKVILKRFVSYPTICKYCRSVNKKSWTDKRLQKTIEDTLDEMGVEWVIPAEMS